MRTGRQPRSPDRRGWRWTPAARRRWCTWHARSASTASCSATARRRCSRRSPTNCRRWNCRSTRRSGRCIWNCTARCWCCAWCRCVPARSGGTGPRLSRPHCRSARIRMFLFVLGHLVAPSAADRRAARERLSRRAGAAARRRAVRHQGLAFRRMAAPDAQPHRVGIRAEPVPVPKRAWRGRAVFRRALVPARLADCWRARRYAELGRLSFSIYLLHFPILFTVVCASLHHDAFSVDAAAFVLFLALTLLAAIAFEHLVDRPAIALSRRVGIVPLVSPREMTQK